MIVAPDQLFNISQLLGNDEFLSIDCETAGLRVHHGDRPFAIVIASATSEYYFEVANHPDLRTFFTYLERFFSERTWFIANASFDLQMLRSIGIKLQGKIWDVLAQERIIYNEHPGAYALSDVARRYGFEKSSAVDEYITEHKLYTKIPLPWRKQPVVLKHFDKVPRAIIVPYAEKDARITFDIGRIQLERGGKGSIRPPNIASKASGCAANESQLSRVCAEMEWTGVKCDRPFSERATAHYEAEQKSLLAGFAEVAERPYSPSPLLFQALFESEKAKWHYTKKGNPSFDADAFADFEHPAAKIILDLRAAKSKLNFYHGFLYHMDANDVVHPSWNQGMTVTGRFSSSNPNFQNLEKPEDGVALDAFTVRRAIVPRPGYILIAPDYDQIEYRLMIEYACRLAGKVTPLCEKVLGGLDVHSAMSILVFGEATEALRKKAKAINFGLLYGQGDLALSRSLRTTKEKARDIRAHVFAGAPEIGALIDKVMWAAREKKQVFNWLGRVSHCSRSGDAYKMPNHLIQGAAADVMKVFMVKFYQWLTENSMKSRIIMTVHDQPVIEVHESEINLVPSVAKDMMQDVFPHKYLNLTAGMQWSRRSLADMEKGMPA